MLEERTALDSVMTAVPAKPATQPCQARRSPGRSGAEAEIHGRLVPPGGVSRRRDVLIAGAECAAPYPRHGRTEP
jgi:hypothetical protein